MVSPFLLLGGMVEGEVMNFTHHMHTSHFATTEITFDCAAQDINMPAAAAATCMDGDLSLPTSNNCHRLPSVTDQQGDPIFLQAIATHVWLLKDFSHSHICRISCSAHLKIRTTLVFLCKICSFPVNHFFYAYSQAMGPASWVSAAALLT
jgi:hypothetical protein